MSHRKTDPKAARARRNRKRRQARRNAAARKDVDRILDYYARYY